MISQEKHLIITFRCTNRRHSHGEILQGHWCTWQTDPGSKKYLCQLWTFLVCTSWKAPRAGETPSRAGPGTWRNLWMYDL